MEKRKPSNTVGRNGNWCSHYETQHAGALENLKSRTTVCSNNPTPGHVSREKSTWKGYMHPSVHCRTVYHSQGVGRT